MKTPQNQEVKIIEAKVMNLKELATIAGRSFLQAYPQNTDLENMALYLKDAFSEKEIKQQLENPEAVFFLMKVGNFNIGYAKLRWDRPHSYFGDAKPIELERFYFLDEFKGKGYGSRSCFNFVWIIHWLKNTNGCGYSFGMKIYQVFSFIKTKDLKSLIEKPSILEMPVPRIC